MSFSVGYRIKVVRGNLGVGEFADALGVNRKTVSRWEADEVLPDGLSLLALKRCFDCDPGWLLTGDGMKPLLDSSEQVLLENFRRCNPTAKMNLIQTSALLAAGLSDSNPAEKKQKARVIQNIDSPAGQVAGRDIVNSPRKK